MRIAIIGSGISGLTVADQLHQQHELTIFEANQYIGGHTNTINVESAGQRLAVDTGFIVFNERTYPNFCRLINRLGVPSQSAPMSFSVRCDQSNLEYRGADLFGLFAQRRNVLRPAFWRLLAGLLKFNRVGKQMLDEADNRQTVGEFFRENRFPEVFYQKYFLPMGSAVWSCSRERFEDFPIRFIADFYHNHGLLGLQDRPRWRVICGGSRQYVRPLVAPFRDRIRLDSPVVRLRRQAQINDWPGRSPVEVTTAAGSERFDHVVLACHADQALAILGDQATPLEREVLSAFPYARNEAVLHTDTTILPRRRAAWASWNYLIDDQDDPAAPATLTYNMNLLQSLDAADTWCVTLNNTRRLDPDKIARRFIYSHPVFDLRRKAMQSRHQELIDNHHTSFCGAWWGNGFHEDGVVSGLAVARRLQSAASVAQTVS